MGPDPPRPTPPLRHTLADSFRFAWAGLGETALRERNMRLHLSLGILASGAAGLLPVSGAERALLLLAVALVLAGESANSALEALVDIVSPVHGPRARTAKDAAAGAVLALAAGSALVLLAVAVPALPAVRERLPTLLPGAAGALVASIAAGLLPSPKRRSAAADLLLFASGSAGIAALAWSAEGSSGVLAAALLLAVAGGAAIRRRRGPKD